MDKTKSPISAGNTDKAINRKESISKTGISFSYANFNDNTALHIWQVLADLYCEQEGLPKMKLSLEPTA